MFRLSSGSLKLYIEHDHNQCQSLIMILLLLYISLAITKSNSLSYLPEPPPYVDYLPEPGSCSLDFHCMPTFTGFPGEPKCCSGTCCKETEFCHPYFRTCVPILNKPACPSPQNKTCGELCCQEMEYCHVTSENPPL